MIKKKTNFDKYVEQTLKKDPHVKGDLERADRAWDIAFQIRELRKIRGLTQAELAALAGISQPNVARIEDANYQHYTLTALDKVTRALNAQVDVVIVPEEIFEEHQKRLPRPVFTGALA